MALPSAGIRHIAHLHLVPQRAGRVQAGISQRTSAEGDMGPVMESCVRHSTARIRLSAVRMSARYRVSLLFLAEQRSQHPRADLR